MPRRDRQKVGDEQHEHGALAAPAALRFAGHGPALAPACRPRRGPPTTVFTVANYPVEARADNAVAAKSKALADGQQAAFRSLLKRLVPVTAYPRIKRLATIKAGDLIEGVRVRSERNSSTEYIASLDFSFQSKAVRDLLRREGIPFTDEQAPARHRRSGLAHGAAAAPRDEPAWTNVWKGLDLEHALTPVKLQALGRRSSPRPSTRSPAATAAPSGRWSPAYGSELRLSPSPSRTRPPSGSTSRSRAATPSAPSRCRAPIASIRAIPATPASWPPWWRSASWRAAGRPSSRAGRRRRHGRRRRGGRDLLITVEFRGMSEWQDISRKLAATPGVEELDVAGLSARGARVTLRYAGGAEGLAGCPGAAGLEPCATRAAIGCSRLQ